MEKKTMMIAIAVVAVILIAAMAGALLMDNGGTDQPATTVKQKGSDTMLELASAWAEDFQAYDGNVSVEISGGGSGTGITALIAKQVDVAQASRAMKSSEWD